MLSPAAWGRLSILAEDLGLQAELQEQLRARGLSDQGKKGGLVTRLREAQQREALSSAGRSNPSSGQAYKVRARLHRAAPAVTPSERLLWLACWGRLCAADVIWSLTLVVMARQGHKSQGW